MMDIVERYVWDGLKYSRIEVSRSIHGKNLSMGKSQGIPQLAVGYSGKVNKIEELSF